MFNLGDNVKPGDLYIADDGGVSVLQSFCKEPTATLRDIESGESINGGVSSLNLKPFKPLMKCTKDELMNACFVLASKASKLAVEIEDWQQQIEQKDRDIAAYKLKLAETANQALALSMQRQQANNAD